MFDIFYIGPKPDLFAHEQQVESIDQAQQQSRTRFFWVVSYLVDYTGFDFLYEPPPWQAHQRHAWPSQWQKDSGTYLVPQAGYVDTNYHLRPTLRRQSSTDNWTMPAAIDFDYTWHPDATDPPYIYQFGTQWQKTNGPVYAVPGATHTKFVNTPRANKRSVDPDWKIPAGVEFEDFDYTWHPDATDPPYIYQFGTQHQRTGGPQYHVCGATDTKFVDQLRIRTNRVATAIYEIDHLDGAAGQIPNVTRRVRYFDNYRDTLIRLARSIGTEHEFVWVCSSICDYTNFDFSWHPEQWQSTMLHVFASDEQKFGDTFFMHVPTFAKSAEHKALLEWYDLNFVGQLMSVPRRPMPIIQHDQDSHVDVVRTQDFAGPLAVFSTERSQSRGHRPPAVALWREKTKTIVPLSLGANDVIVPKAAIPHIKTQLYDYPNIDKTHRNNRTDQESDVIFISNGESMADANWQQLLGLCGRARRSDRILGREAAYKAAARLSTTPWFFAVFAKTEVLSDFKFDYQPDRMQQPKHYIFHSKNPVNNLEYGAMNINLYNRQLVLDTQPGLDFTLSAAHEVVPICASISRFNTDPWVTWRSAFREVLKLQREVDQGADVEIQYRLNTWLTVAHGENAQWCLQGAADAQQYYQSINGDYAGLKLSFDWAWLQDYYFSLYHQRPWLESM
jgi:hypothetical protein